MKKTVNKYRILFAAGGTGGHLYPAISVAEYLRTVMPEAEILFVGTSNRIEAKVVPGLGFNFKTIWISGFQRKNKLKNLLIPIKLIASFIQSLIINIKFNPQVAVGSGAYLTGPVLWASSIIGAKIVLMEQNSYPGMTNRLLEKKAREIHLSFEDSKKYFRDKTKLFLSGNPIRVSSANIDRQKACEKFDLSPDIKTIFVLGGSLGAKSINNAVAANIEKITAGGDVQILWQTGKNYFEENKKFTSPLVKVEPFIDDMSSAYSCAHLVVSRAGASTIAEIAGLGLPVVFVPSPNVAEDHQYKNARSIEENNGCVIIRDSEVGERLPIIISELLDDENKLNDLKNNIKKFSSPDATKIICERIIALAEEK